MDNTATTKAQRFILLAVDELSKMNAGTLQHQAFIADMARDSEMPFIADEVERLVPEKPQWIRSSILVAVKRSRAIAAAEANDAMATDPNFGLL